MEYQPKSLTCSDCSNTFIFSSKEQEEFAAKGYTNVPGRCPTCRAARKAKIEASNTKREGGGTGSYGGGSSGGYGNSNYRSAPRQMFPAKCATCGKDTQVPFQPRSDRPVYCSDCYRKTNPVRKY
jgi:CxxC-x17-CxxC domain-containing protein